MREKFCNVTITYSGGQSAIIEDLTPRQAEQLSAILQASGQWYQWRGDYPGMRDGRREQTAPGGRISSMWRRLAAWMAPLLLISVLSVSALAQKPIEPLRVKVSGPADAATGELVSAVRAELRNLRDVVLVEGRVDYEIQVSGKRIESGGCRGVTAAVLVVRRQDLLHALSIYAGGDFRELAAFLVETVNTENFAGFRAKAFQKRK